KSNSATPVQVSAAQLVLDNAKLALRTAQLALQKRSIITPIGGTVGLFQVTPGNYVNAQTAVTTINDTSTVLVSFAVPERYSSAIKLGTPLTASAVALPGQSITGTVSAIDNKVDAVSRTLEIQGSIPNPKGELRAGMSFSVQLDFPGQQLPAVDPLAIQWSAKGAYVWKYADGKIHQTMVSIIQRNSDGVLVQGALVAGDTVVTQGVQQLADGQGVRLLDDKGVAAADAPGAPPKPDAAPAGQGGRPANADGQGGRPAGQKPSNPAAAQP
ncbi:MAG: putative Co/Zn/Cd efflux system rane fusion protein, partial [Hyphomicrobiales bacterium]|nr:putative Co/Zn/Cd efflux system rane fusion protein [Hyphomicrobiales bacterium]